MVMANGAIMISKKFRFLFQTFRMECRTQFGHEPMALVCAVGSR